MSAELFRRCLTCGAVTRLTPYDRIPVYGPDGQHPVDDRAAFRAAHRGHRMQVLRLVASDSLGPLWDPMSPRRWEVTDGREHFVIEGRRRSVGEPLSYELRPGRLVLVEERITLPREELREEIDAAFFPHVLPERKLRAILGAIEHAAETAPGGSIELLYDVPGQPGTTLGRLPSQALAAVTRSCRSFLDPEESRCLETFLARGSAADVLTVLVTRRYAVLEPQAQARPAS